MFGRKSSKEEQMAEATPQTPPPQADGAPGNGQGAPYLTPRDLLGAIQRTFTDCHMYCGQSPQYVDPRVLLAELERAAYLVSHIPFDPSMGEPNGKDKKAN